MKSNKTNPPHTPPPNPGPVPPAYGWGHCRRTCKLGARVALSSSPGSCSGSVLCQGPARLCPGCSADAQGFVPARKRGCSGLGSLLGSWWRYPRCHPCTACSYSWGMVRCSWSPGPGREAEDAWEQGMGLHRNKPLLFMPPEQDTAPESRPDPPPPAQHLQAPSREGAGHV